MIRLITVITIILMPIVSVSTTTTDNEAFIRSNDLCDEECEGGTSRLMTGDAFDSGKTLSID